MAKLSVLIGADDRELQAALKRARSSLRKTSQEMRMVAGGAAAVAAAAVAAGIAIAAHLVKQTIDAVGAQADLAAQLNTTTSAVTTLTQAATIAGVSMSQIESGGRKLSVALGQAAQGAGPAVDSLKRLNLSADELARMPLDQRIATINQAIREQIPLTQQAAVAADLYGQKAGAAILQISGDQIKEAAEDARIFGNALSTVDSKKIEMAGDSIDRISFAMEGFLTQMTLQAAPVIDAVGKELLKAAKEAGGFGVVAADVFGGIIKGAGFVLDAIDGIGRAFTIAADVMVMGLGYIDSALSALVYLFLTVGDAIPGMDFSKSLADVEQFATDARGAIEEAKKNIDATLMKPMPSVALDEFVEKARKAGQAAAEAAAAAQQGTGGGGDGGGLSDKEREAMQKRLDTMRQQFMKEEELAQFRRDEELGRIIEFENAKLLTEIEAQALREEVEQAHTDRIYDIRKRSSDATIALKKAEHDALKGMTADFMKNLAGLMNTDNRKLFELGKVAAISQAAVSGGKAVMDAWASGMTVAGPFAPVVAAAYAGAAALNAGNLINNIRKQTFGGGGGTPTAPTQGASNISPQGAGGGSTSGGGPTSIINLRGDTFSRDSVRALLERLSEEGSDGGRFVIA